MSERKREYENSTIGNNAVDLSYMYAQPAYEPELEPRITHEKKTVYENVYRAQPRNDANYANINRLCTIVLAFVIIATLAVCVVFLKSQFSYNQLNIQIEDVKKELNTLKRENVQLEEDLNNMVDLGLIYQVATTELGMHLPGPEDVYYIASQPASYTTKYGPVAVEEDQVTFGSVLGYITKGW